MKKKILAPIIALAIAVTAGVNYKIIESSEMFNNTPLSSLVKLTIASAEIPGCGCSEGECCSLCADGNDFGEDASTPCECGWWVIMCDWDDSLFTSCYASDQGCQACGNL